jgi:hypothetical protein
MQLLLLLLIPPLAACPACRQGTLGALGLQQVQPWQLGAGAGVAALLAFSAWRERRTLRRAGRRAAATAAGGLAELGRMALGLSGPVNAMAAVPHASHLGGR